MGGATRLSLLTGNPLTTPVSLSALSGSYMSPVLQAVQADVPRGVHTGTGRVDHHGNGGADVTARSGHRVRLMKPDAHWDIILASCKDITLPARVNRVRMKPAPGLNQTRPD